MLDRLLWLVLAGIHAMPALAFFRPAMMAGMYRVSAEAPLFLLMRHRAALFVVVLVVALWAAVDPATRRLASVAVGFSMLSFLYLWWQAGSPQALRTIAIVDLVGLPALALACWRAFAQG
jgi:hypothetical protein